MSTIGKATSLEEMSAGFEGTKIAVLAIADHNRNRDRNCGGARILTLASLGSDLVEEGAECVRQARIAV